MVILPSGSGRIRAEILLKRDPVNTAAAEQSLQAAIAIAQSQKARSFELRAALSLAKLYRAANRDADAHAVLAPAVDGFPPTEQFPELTEAQTLLSALSHQIDGLRRASHTLGGVHALLNSKRGGLK
jgi:predicted ATPase